VHPAAHAFRHFTWIAWNIPGDHDTLPAAIPLEALFEDGTVQGKNSFGKVGFGGPCRQ